MFYCSIFLVFCIPSTAKVIAILWNFLDRFRNPFITNSSSDSNCSLIWSNKYHLKIGFWFVIEGLASYNLIWVWNLLITAFKLKTLLLFVALLFNLFIIYSYLFYDLEHLNIEKEKRVTSLITILNFKLNKIMNDVPSLNL